MKAYRTINTFHAPGTQPKGADKLDIPTDTQGLIAFLNDLVDDISGQGAIGTLMIAHAVHENLKDAPIPGPAYEPAPDDMEVTEAPSRITDEAFEALPLAYQLHLAALALENARTKVR